MIRRTPRYTRTDTPVPYTTLFRPGQRRAAQPRGGARGRPGRARPRDARRRCDIPRCSWRSFNLEADPETAQPVGQEHGVKAAGPPQDHGECNPREPKVKPFAVGAERARGAAGGGGGEVRGGWHEPPAPRGEGDETGSGDRSGSAT